MIHISHKWFGFGFFNCQEFDNCEIGRCLDFYVWIEKGIFKNYSLTRTTIWRLKSRIFSSIWWFHLQSWSLVGLWKVGHELKGEGKSGIAKPYPFFKVAFKRDLEHCLPKILTFLKGTSNLCRGGWSSDVETTVTLRINLKWMMAAWGGNKVLWVRLFSKGKQEKRGTNRYHLYYAYGEGA